MFQNPRRGRQARNFTTNVPKILVLKSSSEQIFSRKLPLGAPVTGCLRFKMVDGVHLVRLLGKRLTNMARAMRADKEKVVLGKIMCTFSKVSERYFRVLMDL